MRTLLNPRSRARLTAAVLAVGLLITPGGATPLAAPPAPLPPGRDPTVPLGPPVTVQVGGQTVQAAPIARTTTADGREAVADRVIVGFKPGVGAAEQDAVHRAVAAARAAPAPVPLKRVGDSAQYVDVAGAPSLEAAIRAYRADPRVRYAEPDYLVRTTGTPNDPSFPQQYGMARIQAPAAWDATHGSLSVEVAVLDCGIYEDHPDLAGKVVARQDFTGSAYGTDDRCNHGTHVAGIVGADTGNAVGVAGVGYDTALMNGKVLLEQYDSNGNLTGASGSSTWIAGGIRWATDNGAKVISMSLGSRFIPAAGSALTCSQTFQDAVDYATARNVVVVAAAGNDGANELFQPASCAGVVSVASTDQNDARSGFSNYGAWVSVAAPGSAILSTVNPTLNATAAYAYFSGTSMATPHVAGLAALLWATGWGASAQTVAGRLLATADPIAGATGVYWQTGRIDAARAVASPPPVATGLSPSSLPAGSGPFTLTVAGANFAPGAVVRWNGATRATGFASNAQLTAAIPASDLASAGSASVTVANPDGGATAALIFTITASPPRPTGIAPRSGSANGGTTVTIGGGYFRAGASVQVGGAAARVQSVTDTAIVATTPGHAPGTVDVVVTNPDGQNRTLTAAFTYVVDALPPLRPQPAAATGTPPPPPLPPPRATASANSPAGALNGSPAPLPSHR